MEQMTHHQHHIIACIKKMPSLGPIHLDKQGENWFWVTRVNSVYYRLHSPTANTFSNSGHDFAMATLTPAYKNSRIELEVVLQTN